MTSGTLTMFSLVATWLLALVGLLCLRSLTSRPGSYLPQMVLCGIAALLVNAALLFILLPDREDRWGWIILALLIGGSLWYVLFQVINIAVCSIRARVLLELLDQPDCRVAISELEELLGPGDAARQRIARLEQWREIRRNGDHFVLTGRRFLTLNAILDAWRSILGLPRSDTRPGPSQP